MKFICHHQNLTGLPKHCHKNINEAPCTVCFTEKNRICPKGATVYTTKLLPGDLMHVYFAFYNVTYIRGITSVLTVVCENTRII